MVTPLSNKYALNGSDVIGVDSKAKANIRSILLTLIHPLTSSMYLPNPNPSSPKKRKASLKRIINDLLSLIIFSQYD